MKYLDIHAHLNFSDFDTDREKVIDRTLKNNMGVINIGTNLKTSNEVLKLADQYENFYASVGIHPTEAHKIRDLSKTMIEIENIAKQKKVVAIGECGLDYFHISGDIREYKEIQKKVFEEQIKLSLILDLPLMIHCRDAYANLIEILKDFKDKTLDESSEFFNKNLRGNVHFFSGDLTDAREILALNFNISFTGVITFAPQYKELIEFVPIDRIHAETDAPFVAPSPFRGKRNEPLYTLEVIKKISQIKEVDFEDLNKQLQKNAKNLFGIDF